MTPLTPADLRFVDPKDDYSVTFNNAPHWSQAGTIVFITYRTDDSISANVLQTIRSERNRLLREHGIDRFEDWQIEIAKLPFSRAQQVRGQLIEKFDSAIDG